VVRLFTWTRLKREDEGRSEEKFYLPGGKSLKEKGRDLLPQDKWGHRLRRGKDKGKEKKLSLLSRGSHPLGKWTGKEPGPTLFAAPRKVHRIPPVGSATSSKLEKQKEKKLLDRGYAPQGGENYEKGNHRGEESEESFGSRACKGD